MKISHIRSFLGEKYTISHIYVDGKYFCDAIEDKDRGLTSEMTEAEIRKIKVYAQTAIPYGKYKVTIDIVSPKMSQRAVYNPIKGKVPRLLDVKGFDGILVHIGTTEKSSAGCVIVGKNTIKGRVTDSNKVFFSLYALMQKAKAKGESITWEITKKQKI